MSEILTSPTWAEINLDNLKSNFEILKDLCKSSEISAVVKANAYGHGAVDISRYLEKIGVEYFSVSSLKEGLELRKNGIKSPIMILTSLQEGTESIAIEKEIESTVSSLKQAKKISEICSELNKDYNIHIKLDTGMRRIGFEINDDSVSEISKIQALPHIKMKGIFTHFASADEESEFTTEQYDLFKEMVKKLEAKGIDFEIKHVDNDAALMMYDYREDMVRLGIGLYGIYPSNHVKLNTKLDLKPLMTLKSRITHIKTINPGDTIGYGRTFKAKEKMKIATVGIGYADGLPRKISNKGSFFVKGVECPIVGRICMDQSMIDITKINDLSIGDEVVVFGYSDKNKIDIGMIASICDTISYEILSGINRRVPRVYIEESQIVKVVDYLDC